MTLKKLLVLDVNGLLIDTYFYKQPLPEESPDARVGNFYVYKRPFCEEFLRFCLENFIVGIWSSAREYNVNNLVDYVFGDAKEGLAFSWHQSDCTDVGLKAPDNEWKPLFMKDLSKLWRNEKLNLPWSEGDYGPSNTLLVDDTPYKAVLNPPNTAIFPRSYTARDHGDNFLEGALRSYLEGIRDAASVQTYVENNPFGEPSITPESPLWSHVSKVLLKVQGVLNKVTKEIAQVLPVEATSDDIFMRGRRKKWRHRKWNDNSGPLQLTNDDARLFDAFPSETVELQSREKVVPSLDIERLSEEVHGSAVVEQAYKTFQNGKESSVFLGLHKAGEEQSKDKQPRLEIAQHMDTGKNGGVGKMNIETSSSLQLELQGVFKGAADGHMEREQLRTAEETLHFSQKAGHNADARINVELDEVQEGQGGDIGGYGNANGQKACGDSGFKHYKSEWMRVKDIDEYPDEKQELIRPRDNSVVCTSNNYEGSHDDLFHSDHRRDAQRRFQGEPSLSHDKRKYYGKESSDYVRCCKRQRGCYQDNSKRGHGYGPRWNQGRSHQDKNRDRMGHDQNLMRERGRCHGGGTNMLPSNGRDQRRHINNSGHSIYEADKAYVCRNTSFNWDRRLFQQRHCDRPIDNPEEHPWGNSRPPGNAMIGTNSAWPHRSSGNFGHVRSGFPSSFQWHSGFELRVPYKSSNAHPERTQDWNLQGWSFDVAKRDTGGSSESHRDAGANSQSYEGGCGASRLSYKSNGASVHWHHRNSDARRNGLAARGFSRSRLS